MVARALVASLPDSEMTVIGMLSLFFFFFCTSDSDRSVLMFYRVALNFCGF